MASDIGRSIESREEEKKKRKRSLHVSLDFELFRLPARDLMAASRTLRTTSLASSREAATRAMTALEEELVES